MTVFSCQLSFQCHLKKPISSYCLLGCRCVCTTMFIPILASYSKLTSQDDAGAMINDKEDGLWNPRVELSSSMGGVSAQGSGRRRCMRSK